MKLFDKRCRKIVSGNPNMAVAWYLMAGYCYEILNDPLISDGCYDWLCDILFEKYDEIFHNHMHLVHLDDLETGTASGYAKYVPFRTIQAANELLSER